MNHTLDERYFLGCLLNGGSIPEGLTVDCFSDVFNKKVFGACRKLIAEEVPVTITAVEEIMGGVTIDEGCELSLMSEGVVRGQSEFYGKQVLAAYEKRLRQQALHEAQDALDRDDEAALHKAAERLVQSRNPGNGREPGIAFSDLMKKRYPENPGFVESLIYPGLTVFSGASKIGKSFTVLSMLCALDQGGVFLGRLKAQRCDVLYISLEDPPPRVQGRLFKMGTDFSFNGSRLETSKMPMAELKSFLDKNRNFKVVIVDTLQKFMGLADLNDYSQTVDGLSRLKAIADDLGIALVVLHHTRKMSGGGDHILEGLGSTGINGTADSILTMRKQRGTDEATLSATGRDFEDQVYHLQWDRDLFSYRIVDSGLMAAPVSEGRQEVLDLLGDGEMSAADIAEALGKTEAAIRMTLSRLKQSGLIESPRRGTWKKTNVSLFPEGGVADKPMAVHNPM